MAEVEVPEDPYDRVSKDLPKVGLGKRKHRADPEATDSDSDFEELKTSKKHGQRQYLEEYVTMGEMAGRIPPSMIVNINFEKFAVDNDM